MAFLELANNWVLARRLYSGFSGKRCGSTNRPNYLLRQGKQCRSGDLGNPSSASLMKANRELRAKLRRMHQFYEDESSRKGIMAFSTYGKLMKCLHPDSKPSDAERSEACGLLGQWKQSADRARHHA
jgi:hypothetical protein